MPTLDWNIVLIKELFEGSFFVVEPLLFPELRCCDGKSARASATARELARQIIEQLPARELHQRVLPSSAEVEQVEVPLDPPTRKIEWAEPVSLAFDVIRWTGAHETVLAYVPSLRIAMVARRQAAAADVRKMFRDHIVAALRRSKASESLFQLALLQRSPVLSLERLELTIHNKTPKQIARDAEAEGEAAKKRVITQVGVVLNEQPLAPAFEVDGVVGQLADLLTGRSPRSVLLVGPSGVGKTAAVHELVRRRQSLNLGATPFWATSGSRLIASAGGYGMWQQRCQDLCKEAARDGAILHLGNLVELMQVGRFDGSQGIAGFFKTPLSRGDLLVIAECTPEQLPLVERQDPHLLELFHTMRVNEPDAGASWRILQHVADSAVRAGGSVVMLDDESLPTLDRLHRRYATYSAAPGRPVRFLRNLLQDHPADRTIGPNDVIAAFSRETGLPLMMLDPGLTLDLGEARAWFADRLIGQSRAVDLVIDLLATVKASLTRPRRPIASLLFIGPTGVGKTEMAKAIAEYFFGDRQRLTRFDMSEFASPAAVERLIGGAFGAEGLLTAKVREQPFSVMLFDEFEKAHGGFFDLLLQILGDGRLTDAAGRVGDFSNTILIMTSNLGAESFDRGAFGLARGPGAGGMVDAERHFTEEVRSFVRPELFNRIDRIVPFLPLDSSAIREIAGRELSLVEQRDGVRLRQLSMTVSPAARQLLADNGYDVRYGARPLKRAIERQLLAPLADGLNRYPSEMQLQAEAQVLGGQLSVNVRPKTDAAGKVIASSVLASSNAAVAERCAALRRDVQLMRACSAVVSVTNLLFQLEREQKRAEQRARVKKKPVYDADRAERLRGLRRLLDDIEALSEEVNQAENAALAAVYGSAVSSPSSPPALHGLQARFDDLLLQLLARQASKPHRATIGMFCHIAAVLPLAAAYTSIARNKEYRVEMCWYEVHGRSAYRRHRVEEAKKFFDSPPDSLVGIAMLVDGPYAWFRFAPEAGVHTFERSGKRWACLVNASEESLVDFAPPGRDEWPADAPATDVRRFYDLVAGVARDRALAKERRWSGRSIEPVVSDAIEDQLRRAARAVIES